MEKPKPQLDSFNVEVEAVRKIVEEFCEEDGMTKRDIAAAMRPLKVLKRVNADWFLLWDALGVYPDRNPFQQALYEILTPLALR